MDTLRILGVLLVLIALLVAGFWFQSTRRKAASDAAAAKRTEGFKSNLIEPPKPPARPATSPTAAAGETAQGDGKKPVTPGVALRESTREVHVRQAGTDSIRQSPGLSLRGVGTWSDSVEYKALLKPHPSTMTTEGEELQMKIAKEVLDRAGIDPSFLNLIDETERSEILKNVRKLVDDGRAKEAVPILVELAQSTKNVYMRGVALAHLIDAFKKVGDEKQALKAQTAMIIVGTQIQFQMYPKFRDQAKAYNPAQFDLMERAAKEPLDLAFRITR